MATTIGALEIDLIANIARLQSDMNKATSTVDRAMGGISKAVGSAQNLLLGLGVGVSFSALIGQVNKAIGVLGDLDDMAQKTGSSVENLSRLQKVATQFGADFGAVDVAIGKLSKGLAGIDDAGGKTAKALNAIGISQQFVKDNDPSEVMIEVAKKLQNYQDGASKAALATDLFGKAGIELLPYLNDVADNVDRFAGVSAEAAAKAAKLQDDLGGLKVGFSELVDTVTIGILPAMTEFISKLNQVLKFKSLFSSVGGIEAKDYDKELANREEGLKSLQKSRDNLSKPTLANKINDFVFGDVGDLDRQITIFNDEIKALKELKVARDALNASPYVSPNSDKPALDYKGAEAEAKIESDRSAAASKAEAARKKQYEEALKDIQRQVDFEQDIQETVFKKQVDDAKELKEQQDKLTKEEYDNKIKYMDLLQKESDKRFEAERDAIKKIEDERLRAQERISDQFSQSLTDAIFRGFEDGKSFIKNFKDTLINSFKTLVLQPVIKFLVDSSGITAVLGALGGALSGNANAGEGGSASGSGGGIGGLFSSVKDFFGNGNSSFISAIEGFGANIANGMGGIRDVIGGFIGENAGAIADGFGYFGAVLALSQGKVATAIGTGIGTFFWGPIGGAIGGFLGGIVDSLFGGKDYDRFGSSVRGTLVDGKYKETSRGVVYDKDIGAGNALSDVTESYLLTLSGFANKFGELGTARAGSELYQRGKSKVTGANFGATINGEAIEIRIAQKDSSPKKVFDALVERIFGEGLAKGIQASNISEGVKKFFDGLTKKEDVANAIITLTSLSDALLDLPAVFNAVRNAIDTTSYTTTIDQLKAQFAATQTFVGLFYSEAEKFGIFSGQLSTQLESLNKVLPASREEYRAWVDSMNVVDAASRDQFNGLIALAPAMDQYFKLLEQQKEGINEVNKALADGLDANLYSTYANYASAQASTANGINASSFMGERSFTNQISTELIAETKALRAENVSIRTVLEAIAISTAKTAKIQKQWNDDGTPEERVI